MRVLIVFFLLFSLTSCTTLQIIHIGLQKKDDETPKQFNAYLKKHRIKYDYSLELIDSTAYLLKDSLYRLDNAVSTKFSLIQLRIYDSEGNLYSGYSQCTGDFNSRKNLNGFPPAVSSYPFVNTNLKFKNEFDLVALRTEEKASIVKKAENSKYVFVVYWNIWTRYFSRHVLREVSQLKRKYKEDLVVVLVNVAKD